MAVCKEHFTPDGSQRAELHQIHGRWEQDTNLALDLQSAEIKFPALGDLCKAQNGLEK
jgi:hypothetical protein